VLERLRHSFGADETAINEWCATWITSGFDAFEALVSARSRKGPFSFGEKPTVADVYLIPQIESARRFKVDTARWRRLCEIEGACLELDAFRRAAPAVQADAT
jgi:maleylpyruvate isomerase